MYAENLTFSKDNILANTNISYDSVMSSIIEYSEIHYDLKAKIRLFESNLILKDEANPSDNGGAKPAENNGSTGSNKFSATIKEYSTKLMAVLQKVIAKIKDYVSIVWNKIKEIIAKLREKIESTGVKAALEKLEANSDKYRFNDSYYNEKVKDAEFSEPTSAEISKVYSDVANKYLNCAKELKDKDPENFSQPVKDEDKEKLKNVQGAKKKGSELTNYFANNLKSALPLVKGLCDSLEKNSFEKVLTEFNTIINNIKNELSTNGQVLSRGLSAAAQKNDTNEIKKYQERSKALVSIGNAIIGLSGGFKTQLIQMNISRLKIVNTFIKLWKESDSEGSADNKENSKAEEPKEKPAENVNDANAP